MTSGGFQRIEGSSVGYNHTMTDLERGDYSESGVHGSGDWYGADPASMRDCKASHRGG